MSMRKFFFMELRWYYNKGNKLFKIKKLILISLLKKEKRELQI